MVGYLKFKITYNKRIELCDIKNIVEQLKGDAYYYYPFLYFH